MIATATYLAAKRPWAFGRALVRIGSHYAVQVWTDTKAVTRIIGEELLHPEWAEQKAAHAKGPLGGSIVVLSPWIPLALFGSHLAHSINNIFGTLDMDNAFGSQDQEAVWMDYAR
jgi:hypothetical protein